MHRFSPEALTLQFTRGLAGWFLQVILLKGLLYSLGGAEAPLLDIVAYGGYAFTGLSVAILARLVWNYSYYFVFPWFCLCMGVFLVKTMKRVLFTQMKSYENSSRHNYLLLLMGIVQFPLFFWLGRIGAWTCYFGGIFVQFTLLYRLFIYWWCVSLWKITLVRFCHVWYR